MIFLRKALIYRVYATLLTGVIALAVTGSFRIAATISFLEIILKTLGYLLFEAVWEKSV